MDSITPSPREGIGVMGRRPGPGVNEADVTPNLPTLKGGKGVRPVYWEVVDNVY